MMIALRLMGAAEAAAAAPGMRIGAP